MTSAKILGAGMKCDTYDPDYPKALIEIFNYFTPDLNILCTTLPIVFADSSDPLYSLSACLIRSHIFNLESLVLISGCM